MEDAIFESGNMLLEIIGCAMSITLLVWFCVGHSSQLSILTARFITGLM